MISLLYVSNSALAAAEQEEEIEAILRVANCRNAELGVTGSLIFTGSHFAQILEGELKPINTLMESIKGDRRHKDVRVVDMKIVSHRVFPIWNMGYWGPSAYVTERVSLLLSLHHSLASLRNHTSDLRKLMHELGTSLPKREILRDVRSSREGFNLGTSGVENCGQAAKYGT